MNDLKTIINERIIQGPICKDKVDWDYPHIHMDLEEIDRLNTLNKSLILELNQEKINENN